MSPYLPQPAELLGVAVTWGLAAVLLLAGAGMGGRRVAPEAQIVAGWGALCLVLTLWGVFTPASLRLPAVAFVVAAALVALTGRRPRAGAWLGLGRMLVLSLPLWVILAPIRPSQPDTFLNLLPNAFYLVDYARLPTAALPSSHSYLPGAPYNTQFLSFLPSLVLPDYPAGGMSLVNLLLQLVAGLAIARALARQVPERAPGWGVTALGLLLATLLNPGFVPRIDLSAYGEAALAAAALIAARLFAIAQGRLAAGEQPGLAAPLGLALAALVNTKQSGIGLLLALTGAMAASALAERGVPRWAALRLIALSLLPAIGLFLVWRYHLAHAGVAELSLLPAGQWNWPNLAATADSALKTAAEKPLYFACVAASLGALAVLWRRQGWTPATRLLALHMAAFVLYNGFLLATYVALFPGEMSAEAHSYFRYNTHLSLLLVLALALAARDLGAGAWLSPGRLRLAAAAAIVLLLVAPLGFARRLRFDLDMPQPLVWDLAKRVGAHLEDGDRLALLLPGDNDSVATMLAGVLRDAPPRRRSLELLRRDRADAATLEDAAARGYRLALISCTPEGLAGLPAGEAVLLRHGAEGWRMVAAWPYPAAARRQRWQHILAWAPLCREPG